MNDSITTLFFALLDSDQHAVNVILKQAKDAFGNERVYAAKVNNNVSCIGSLDVSSQDKDGVNG